MPALNKARARAQTASCLNNMKQNGLGFAQYGDDNQSIVPLAYYRDSGSGRTWLRFLRGEIDNHDWKHKTPSYIQGTGTGVCPSIHPFKYGEDSTAVYGVVSTSPGNLHADYRNTAYCNTDYLTYLLPAKAKGPSQWVVLSDSLRHYNNLWTMGWVMAHKPSGSTAGMYFVHNERANWLFLDGHAESCAVTDTKPMEIYRIQQVFLGEDLLYDVNY